MQSFIFELKARNETLFYFGLICLVAGLVFLAMTRLSTTQVYGVNAWFKPFKFAVSIGTFAWTMAWYCFYLPNFNIGIFNWTVVILFGLEIFYIALMAAQGKQSHFNISSSTTAFLYGMMGIAAAIVTLYTAYIGILFFTNDFPTLPNHYLWSIRLGIIIFVIFSFEGGLMGSRMNHSVGMINDNSNLFIFGWSKLVGDLRVAHFIGMHSLQVLPILSFYLLKDTKLTILFAILYGALAVFTLVQALGGRPVFKG